LPEVIAASPWDS